MSSKLDILVEAFGAATDEDTYADDIDIDAIAEAALDELHSSFGAENINSIVTGMNASFTYALQRVTEDHSVFGHIDIDPFYPNVSRRMEEDDLEYREAWKQGYNWRNEKCFTESGESDDDDSTTQEQVDLTVRVGDAGNNGEELLRQSRQHGINFLDINIDSKVDKDAAYGDSEAESESEQNAELDDFEDDSPSVEEINGIGETYADRLSENGIDTVAELSVEDPETIGNFVDGVSASRASEWVEAAEKAA